MKILLTWAADDEELARIRAVLPADAELVVPPHDRNLTRFECNPGAVVEAASDAGVMMGWAMPDELIEAAPALELLVCLDAGLDHHDFNRLRERGIQATNASSPVFAAAVAEQAFALILGMAKNVLFNHRCVLEGYRVPWWQAETAPLALTGKVLGIVGLGRIGQQIAKRASAFDMRVIGTKRYISAGMDHVDRIYPPDELHAMLSGSDIVVVAAPLTPETHNLIDEPELQAMKPTAFLVNIARGHIVAERAVYRALTEGWIAGLGTDCWWDYGDARRYMPPSTPFPATGRTRLHMLPNVLGSPDVASDSLMVKDTMINQGILNLAAYVKGEPLPSAVDLGAGY